MDANREVSMAQFMEHERRASDIFATKEEVSRLSAKLDSSILLQNEHASELAVLRDQLTRINKTLERIFWAITTPLLGAVGFSMVWILTQVWQTGF